MTIDYFANFCDSGHCFNEKHRCIYPKIKVAPLEMLQKIDWKGAIKKIFVEVDCHDKLHAYWSPNESWEVDIYLNDVLLCHLTHPVSMGELLLSEMITDIPPEITNILQTNQVEAKCYLHIDNDICCPYNLYLIVFTEE